MGGSCLAVRTTPLQNLGGQPVTLPTNHGQYWCRAWYPAPTRGERCRTALPISRHSPLGGRERC